MKAFKCLATVNELPCETRQHYGWTLQLYFVLL